MEFCLGIADVATRKVISEAGYAITELREEAWFDAEKICEIAGDQPFSVLIDISHPLAVPHAPAVALYCEELRAGGASVAVIDSMMTTCLGARVSLPVDLLVIPYSGAERQTVLDGPRHLALGVDFVIFDPSYAQLEATASGATTRVDRLLVAAGGSDPTKAMLICLQAIELVRDPPKHIRVIVGPGFDPELTAEIERHCAGSSLGFELIHGPKTLAQHISWCDLALSASGLTKYELARCGKPALLFSIDQLHADANLIFCENGCAKEIGIVETLEPAYVADELTLLIADGAQRGSMSKAGRKAVDGSGSERILELLEK